MQISTNGNFSYMRVMVRYTLLTLLSALGCSFFGYVFLPFAAAFYATILLFENPAKRVVSYVLPVIVLAINFLLRGMYSLEAVAYLIVGLLICFCIRRNKSKGETAFWLSFAILVCLVVSALLLIFELSNKAGYASVSKFYSDTFNEYRKVFLDTVTSLIHEDSDGIQSFAYNLYEANLLFRELIIYLIPVAFLLSFVISGLTLKVFCRAVARNAEEDSDIYAWHFGASNVISYFFIAVSFLAFMSNSDGSAFSYVLFTLNTIFTAVFAYIGLKSLYYIVIARGKSRFFAIVLIIIAFALFSSFAFQILSYFGVIVNIVTNKVSPGKRSDT